MIYALAWTVSSSLHPRLRAEVFANNDLCTFCWPHPSSLPAQLAPDIGGRGKAQLGGKEESQRGRPTPTVMDLASDSRSSHPQEGLSREVRYLGSPTWPQGAPDGRAVGHVCMSGVRIAWFSNQNSHSCQAFFSDLGQLLAPTSDHAVTSALTLALLQGSWKGNWPQESRRRKPPLDLMGCRPRRLPGILRLQGKFPRPLPKGNKGWN